MFDLLEPIGADWVDIGNCSRTKFLMSPESWIERSCRSEDSVAEAFIINVTDYRTTQSRPVYYSSSLHEYWHDSTMEHLASQRRHPIARKWEHGLPLSPMRTRVRWSLHLQRTATWSDFRLSWGRAKLLHLPAQELLPPNLYQTELSSVYRRHATKIVSTFVFYIQILNPWYSQRDDIVTKSRRLLCMFAGSNKSEMISYSCDLRIWQQAVAPLTYSIGTISSRVSFEPVWVHSPLSRAIAVNHQLCTR